MIRFRAPHRPPKSAYLATPIRGTAIPLDEAYLRECGKGVYEIVDRRELLSTPWLSATSKQIIRDLVAHQNSLD